MSFATSSASLPFWDTHQISFLRRSDRFSRDFVSDPCLSWRSRWVLMWHWCSFGIGRPVLPFFNLPAGGSGTKVNRTPSQTVSEEGGHPVTSEKYFPTARILMTHTACSCQAQAFRASTFSKPASRRTGATCLLSDLLTRAEVEVAALSTGNLTVRVQRTEAAQRADLGPLERVVRHRFAPDSFLDRLHNRRCERLIRTVEQNRLATQT